MNNAPGLWGGAPRFATTRRKQTGPDPTLFLSHLSASSLGVYKGFKLQVENVDYLVDLRGGTPFALNTTMKRVLQHSKTGLYLSLDGGFTREWDHAHVCPNLAAAMLVCARFRLNPTDFVYRIVEPEYACYQTGFCGQHQVA